MLAVGYIVLMVTDQTMIWHTRPCGVLGIVVYMHRLWFLAYQSHVSL